MFQKATWYRGIEAVFKDGAGIELVELTSIRSGRSIHLRNPTWDQDKSKVTVNESQLETQIFAD